MCRFCTLSTKATAPTPSSDGTATTRTTPVDVGGLAGVVVELAAGGGHTCARLSGGDLQCWGLDSFAEASGTFAGIPPHAATGIGP